MNEAKLQYIAERFGPGVAAQLRAAAEASARQIAERDYIVCRPDTKVEIVTLPAPTCGYCGQRAPDDSRGGCGACGAPRSDNRATMIHGGVLELWAPETDYYEPSEDERRMLSQAYGYTFEGKVAELQARIDETECEIGSALIAPISKWFEFWESFKAPFVWIGERLQ